MNTPNITEIAQIAAIISDNIMDELYEYNNSHNYGGYIFTTEQIAGWAIEFYYKTQGVNWEKLQETNKLIIPYTNEREGTSIYELEGFSWDDFVANFAIKKFKIYSK
jgi:hypothetical protein